MSQVLPMRTRSTRSPKLAALSDEGLARACAAGDPAAIGALFDRFQPRVTRYLRRLVHEDAVEDAVQAVFIEVARGKAVYDGRASVNTWLFAIATNVARHERRSFARRRRLGAALRSLPPRGSTEPQRLDARDLLEHANLALRALSAPLREAFVLCELEGLSAAEAAQALETSEAAIWKRVSKARKAIRQQVLGEKGSRS
ncbi:MAG: RNA polymerase sigma factor [Myxococcota bacterium]